MLVLQVIITDGILERASLQVLTSVDRKVHIINYKVYSPLTMRVDQISFLLTYSTQGSKVA